MFPCVHLSSDCPLLIQKIYVQFARIQRHAQLFTKFRGETEAAVNLPLVYVQHVKFGYTLDQAFINSFARSGIFTIDRAAVNWMITENFRLGNEMDTSNSEYNEMRYQVRMHWQCLPYRCL